MKGIALSAVMLVAALAVVQHQHERLAAGRPQNSAEAAHHAFLEQERAAIEKGEGFGMAMPADMNGFPGPRHVLDMKAELKLTAGQETAMQKLYERMHQKALERGREVLAAEQRLGQMFAEKRSEAELREETYRAASLRAELRWVHLRTHLAARNLLTAAQVDTYMRLRHGGDGHSRMHPGA